MSFAERLLRRRAGLNAITGINGGNLDDQLQRDQLNQSPDRMAGVASAQVSQPTMADQYMATAQPVEEQRPRQTSPFQQRLMAGRQRIADPTAFDTQHLRELESRKDPKWERILNAAAAGVTSAAQGGAPIKPIPTRRERDIATVGNRLGRDVALENAQLKQAQSQLIDVDVPDGQGGMIHTKVPQAKVAGTLQANEGIRQRQQKIDATANKPIYRKDAQGRIVKITPQADGADKTETVVNVVKTAVPHTVWADGQLKIWNPESGRYDNAKDTQDREITDELKTPVTVDINGKKFRVAPNTAAMATATGERFNITEDRAERGEVRQDERDYRGRMAKAADLVGKIDGAKEAMRAAKAALTRDPDDVRAQREFDTAKAYAVQAAKELNEGYGDIYEAGIGTEGTPYYKRVDTALKSSATRRTQPSPSVNTSGSFNLGAWKADHPNATAEQIQSQRAKAKARKLAIVE
jgi:hypothetical protein